MESRRVTGSRLQVRVLPPSASGGLRARPNTGRRIPSDTRLPVRGLWGSWSHRKPTTCRKKRQYKESNHENTKRTTPCSRAGAVRHRPAGLPPLPRRRRGPQGLPNRRCDPAVRLRCQAPRIAATVAAGATFASACPSLDSLAGPRRLRPVATRRQWVADYVRRAASERGGTGAQHGAFHAECRSPRKFQGTVRDPAPAAGILVARKR
jgi:hypothetical protein